MHRAHRQSGFFLLLLYAFFFVSTTMFVHTHSDMNVTHSHPWSSKTHTHTGAQIQLINILTDITSLSEETVVATEDCRQLIDEVDTDIIETGFVTPFVTAGGLRAPPSIAA